MHSQEAFCMASSSLEKQVIELKDTIRLLNRTMESLQKSLDAALAREEEYLREKKNLQEQINYLTNKIYGSSSEKRVKNTDIEGQQSLELFNEAEEAADEETDPDEDSQQETITYTRKKKTTKTDKFANLPAEEYTIELPEEERFCKDCGTELVRIGREFLRTEIKFIPGQVTKVNIYSATYECRECKKKDGISHITKAREGVQRSIRGMAAASTLAWVFYQKYVNSIPLYRQEKDWRLYGCNLDRGTLANWIIWNSTGMLKPMVRMFGNRIVKGSHAMADETPVQVLHESGRSPTSKSHMWVFRTGEFQKDPAIVYKYAPTRSGQVAVDFFNGFSGYLMCDGFSGYNVVPDIKRTGCFAHVRRYLLDGVAKAKQMDYSIPAVQGVMYIDKLFEYERAIHAKGATPDEVKQFRLKKEKPVLDSFFKWADAQSPVRGSKFYKAIIYIRNQREHLMRYLEDGLCSFSNNASERCCKDFVVGRKNWLFSDSAKGADASAYAYSAIQTAKANGLNPYHYLCFLFEKGPSDLMTDDELEKFAPWNEDVKAEIKLREAASREINK